MPAKRCVVIHGHFYQPPRENPWTETIDRQDSAKPRHDWNERVAWECYIPNGDARVMGADGRIADLVNNYAHISFNFGPTLLSWFETHFPQDYRRILEADRDSRRALGHGNAIAQAYNHAILPLADPRDQRTQVLWGIEDFRRRFGREPEALWIPETAANLHTLSLLAKHGMRYVILSPLQVQKVRPPQGEWKDVSAGGLDTRRPYRVHLPGRGWMPAFFYDHGLASAVAFEKLMSEAARVGERLEAAFDPAAVEDQLVHIATDGESYGHHHPFADQCLAYLMTRTLPERGIEVTNYAAYLDAHPPEWEAVLKPGPAGEGTAWSCAHGLGRWKENCGCGDPGTSQAWRGPMREAMDWLRDTLAEGFEECGLFKDPWKARDAYIGVVLDRPSAGAFLRRELREPGSGDAAARALKWLELQRHALLMYTSCGWFFSEISGIESVQCLQYAARALQLFRELGGDDLEPDFLERLADAPSNVAEYGNGRGVYEKLVRSRVVTPEYLTAYYAFTQSYERRPERRRLTHYVFEKGSLASRAAAGMRCAAGSVAVVSGVTGERAERSFLAAARPGRDLEVYVGTASDPAALEQTLARLSRLREEDLAAGFEDLRRPLFPDPPFRVQDLLIDEREELLELMTGDSLEKLRGLHHSLQAELLPLLDRVLAWGLAVPAVLRAAAEFALNQKLLSEIEDARRGDKDLDLGSLREDLERARRMGIELSLGAAEKPFEEIMRRRLDALEADWNARGCRALADLVAVGRAAKLSDWTYRTQNRLFALLRGPVAARLAGLEGRPLEPGPLETFEAFFDLCDGAGVDAAPARLRLAPPAPSKE